MLMGDPRHARKPGDPAPFLARARLFRDAPAEARAELARVAWRAPAARGTVVYGCGEVPDGVYVVAAGHVALSVHEGDEREKVVDICGPGESFGEDCLTGGPSNVTARVVTGALLVHVPRQALLNAIERHPAVATCVLQRLACKILQATNQIGGGATRAGLQRLAGYLLRHLPADVRESASITLGVPKRVAASLLGLTKETFSRLLGMLAERGLIEVRGRTIHIERPEALVTLCHEGAGCGSCCGCARGGSWLP